MKYDLTLNDRPFQAIRVGTKKIEGRAMSDENDKRYEEMKAGDIITFTNNITSEELTVDVLFVTHYSDVKTMLETEGTKNVLSSGGNIEEGKQSYYSLSNYKERIEKWGIYAIGVRPI